MSKRYGEYEQVNGSTVNAAFDSIEKLEKQLENFNRHICKEAALEKQLEGLRATRDHLQADVEKLQKQLEAVRPYIQHQSDCATILDGSSSYCDCGLEAAIGEQS